MKKNIETIIGSFMRIYEAALVGEQELREMEKSTNFKYAIFPYLEDVIDEVKSVIIAENLFLADERHNVNRLRNTIETLVKELEIEDCDELEINMSNKTLTIT